MYRSIAALVVVVLLGSLVAACERPKGPTATHGQLVTTGKLHVDWTVQASAIGSGDMLSYRLLRGSRVGSNPVPTVITVEQPGITTLALEQWERETSSGLTARSWLRKQALFVISAPEGAIVEMPFSDAIDPRDVRGTIDYDGDGTVDAELTPTVAAAGDDLLEADIVEVVARVEEGETGKATVSLVPTRRSGAVTGIYYAIYPGQPQLRFYSEPFVVEEPSYILYGSYGEQGQRQQTQELEILGGPDDVVVEASVDGRTEVVETTVPGQNIIITVPGAPGQRAQIDIAPLSGGVQPDNQATLEIVGPDGVWLREAGIRSADGLGEEGWSETLHLNIDGVYKILIDPRLSNVISTTVTISPAS